MTNLRRIFTLLVVGFTFYGKLYAQDPEFTQFYANPLYLNPAFAGTAGGPRFCVNFRDQWPSVSGNFVTYAASYDEHFDGIGGGIGAQVMSDHAGDGNLTTNSVSGMYSYQLTLKDNGNKDYFIVNMAIEASAFQRSIDWSKLTFGDEIDARLGFIYTTKELLATQGVQTTAVIPDFSAGVLAYTSKFFAGIAVNHIIQPEQSFFNNPASTLPMKLTIHVGTEIAVDNWKRDPETFISPNILFQRQAKFTQVNFGAYLIKTYFMAGLWYRQTAPNSDAIMALIGVRKDAVQIGYSYDLTVSQARTAATGSHEVSLIVQLQKYDHQKKKKWRAVPCPGFK